MTAGLLVTGCELEGRTGVDVRMSGGRIADIGTSLPVGGDAVVSAGGGALIPGLHDHHIHLLSLAASLASVDTGPPAVRTQDELRGVLSAAAAATRAGGWLRGFGYHESVAGDLDRHALDQLVADRPVRIQHRSGALWILNSAGLAAAGISHPTGRLFRADADLAARLPRHPADLAAVGRLLAQAGVTGVTDATPDLTGEAVDALAAARAAGELPQRVTVLGAAPDPPSGLATGPHKLILDEARGIDFGAVVDAIAAIHATGRAVAIHAVTRAEVAVAVEAVAEAGAIPGDRIEHGSELAPELDPRVAALGITVVTQPNFVAERGDEYERTLPPDDLAIVYRCAGLLASGIAVAAGTDAPFGRPDPWAAIAAAVERRTASGSVLGAAERLAPARALALFLGAPGDPGGPPRRLIVGAPADACLLHVPLVDALAAPDRAVVAATIVAGHVLQPNSLHEAP